MKSAIAFGTGFVAAAVLAVVLYFAPVGSPGMVELPEFEPPIHAEGFVPSEHRNAALRYIEPARMLHFINDDLEAMPRLVEIDDWAGLTKAQAEGFERRGWFLDSLEKASRIEACEWQPALEEGYNAELYWLSFMHRFIRVAFFSAEAAVVKGEHDLALGDFATALRIAEHVGRSGFLMTGNVSSRWARRIASRVEAVVEFEQAEEATRKDWLAAIGRFDKPDPFGFIAGIENQVEWSVRLSGFELLRLEEGSISGFSSLTMPDEPILPRSAADEAEINRMMEQARRWKHDMLVAWELGPEAKVNRVREIGWAVDVGEYTPNDRKTLSNLVPMAERSNWALQALASSRAAAASAD